MGNLRLATEADLQGHARVHRIGLPGELRQERKEEHKGRKQASPPEREVLAAVLQLLKHHPKVAWARRINSGAGMKKGFYVRFGFVGCSDIIGQMKDGKLLAVETKRANGRDPSVPQKTFIAMVRANHGIAGIVHSVKELQELLG